MVVSTEILSEYTEIIQRHMGSVVAETILGVIENMENLVQVSSYFKFNLIKSDLDDNKFVDCAIAANADFILTEDKHFLQLKTVGFPKVEIKTISEFKSMEHEEKE